MVLENILSQAIVQKLGWTLLHFVWQASAVALLLGILLVLLRKSSANVRYIVACTALGLIVLLPVVTIQMIHVSTPQPTANTEPPPATIIMPAQPITEETLPSRIDEYEEPVQPESISPALTIPLKQRAVEKLEPALPHIVTIWLLGVFGLSLWHLGGWAQLQRLRKKMVTPVDDSVHNRLLRLSEKLNVKRAIPILESALVQVPTVVGWLRPIILLPASALTGLTSEQLEALLTHELAHIRRYDYLFNMLQTVVETLGFYHPAVWWISHRIRIERENCCDDLAVSISGDRVRYAKALTLMEEIRTGRNELAVAVTGGNLFGRIHRLVGKDSTESSRTSWIPSVITILLIAIIVIPTTLALTTNENYPTEEFITNKSENGQPENEPPKAEKIDSSTKILIETRIIHVNNEFLQQVGLDAASLKNSNPWMQYRVDDSSNPSMFVIDSHRKEMLLKTIDESEDSLSISRIFMMTMSGQEAMIKNNSGYDFKSQELGRFIKIKPELSQDGKKVNVNCELMVRQFKNLDLFFDVYINKKIDQNDVSESEVVEYRSNAGNTLLFDDHTLLILGGKLVSLRDVENGPPILRDLPVLGEIFNTTSKVKVEKNDIILIKTSVAMPQQSDDVDSKASSYNVAKIVGSKTSDLLRIYLDLHLEAGHYVEIKENGQRESKLKQVVTSDIGKHAEDFPAYVGYIDFEIRSNFDLNLATKRHTKGSFFEHDKWDAYFTGPDTIIGNGNFSTTTLCVCMWRVKLYEMGRADDDIIPSLVAVIIKPSNKPQESPAEKEEVDPNSWQEKDTDASVKNKALHENPQPQAFLADNVSEIPQMAKSAAPSDVDKPIVRIDLSVVEVSSGSEVDRETTIEIRNLLAGKITVPDSPAVADLLRDTAGATAAVKDESAGDKRVTQEQFKTLFDLLVSRGHLKILMNPTLEVVEGQTAQIKNEQNSLEVTANAVEDDIIYLTVKADLSSQIAPANEGQKPIISTRSFANFVSISSDQSQIIGGMVQMPARPDANTKKSSQTSAGELICIVTASIIAPVEPKEPMETVNYENVEVRMIIEKLAEWSGKVIIPHADLMKQKITIHRPQKLSRSEAVALILNSLRSKGYSAEQTDETIYLKPLSKEQHGKEAKEPPADKPMIRVYDISDLVHVGARISRGAVDVMMGGSDNSLGGHVNIPDQAVANEARNIVNLIMQTIDPNSWYENNPNATGIITPFPAARPRKLAIYQTLHVHQKVEKFLESRREQTDTTQISIALRYLYTNVEFLDEVRDSMGIEFKSDTFLDDIQLGTLLRASQKKRNIKTMVVPIVKVRNNETAQFKTVRQVFMSFLDYSKLNNLSKQSSPVPVDTFCRITPHIEDNKNIIIDLIQDIPGLQESIIYDRREMVQSYTETTAITNKRIPNNKTFAFTCDIRQFDQDNQTASPAEKKTLIVLIKPTIIVQEEMPRSEAAAMILNSLRSESYTAEQSDETILLKSAKEEQPGTGKTQIMIDTKILKVDEDFLKDVGLDSNSIGDVNVAPEPLIKDESTVNKEYEVVQMSYADVMEVVEQINKALQQMPGKDLRERVLIQPLEHTRQIIIFGRPDRREMVKKLIAEIEKQAEHSIKLSNLGKALSIYANDHDGKYPDSIVQVKQYLETEDFAWVQQNVTYYGRGRTVADLPDMRLARDNRQAAETKGTNFLYNDGRVEFIKSGRQKDRGIGKDQILIDTRILTASDEFLKYIGFDPNSVVSSKDWSDHLVYSTNDSASFVIDQLHADLLLRNVAARMRTNKDIRMLTKPQVFAKSGKKFEIHIPQSKSGYYILRSLSEPNALSGESESKSNRIELGTTVRLTPTLTPDGQNIELDFEWEYRRLIGVKEHTNPDGTVQKVPQIDVDSIKTPCTVPDGKTLLIAGKKITEQKKKEPRKFGLTDLPLIGRFFYSPPQAEEKRNLLIMVTPRTIKVKPSTDIKAPRIPPSVDPNDPLIKKLEEKFKRYDDQKIDKNQTKNQSKAMVAPNKNLNF